MPPWCHSAASPDDRGPGARLDLDCPARVQIRVRYRARQMRAGPEQGGAVAGVEVHQAPDHVQRHGEVRAARERQHRVVLAIDVHLEALGRVPLSGRHGNADVPVVQQRGVAEHGAHDVHHRWVEVELVEVWVLADDGVGVAQVVGLRAGAARDRLLGVEQLADGAARGADLRCRQRVGDDGVAPRGQLREPCVRTQRSPAGFPTTSGQLREPPAS